MNTNRVIRLLPLLILGPAMADITHHAPSHLTTSTHHLTALPMTGPGHLAASMNSNMALMQANMNGSLNSMAGWGWGGIGFGGYSGWSAMPGMMPMAQPMPMLLAPPQIPIAPIAATELSPLASPPVMPPMQLPIAPVPVPTMSYMSQTINGPWGSMLLDEEGLPITNQLEATSLFAFAPEKPRVFKEHDLVQIVVRETTRIASFQGLETDKEFGLVGGVRSFPGLNSNDLLKYTQVDLGGEKEFEGEGEYAREDDLTTRLTAEVIEILPNGNLVLEARTRIKTDDEEMFTQLTGTCRPDDVTAANTILSNQIFNLEIEKLHYGQVRDAANKGILARILDVVFAF